MKPVEQWTLKECVDMCRVSDCEDCLLEELCGKGVDRWELPMRFTKKELDALGSFSKIGIKAQSSLSEAECNQNCAIVPVPSNGFEKISIELLETPKAHYTTT